MTGKGLLLVLGGSRDQCGPQKPTDAPLLLGSLALLGGGKYRGLWRASVTEECLNRKECLLLLPGLDSGVTVEKGPLEVRWLVDVGGGATLGAPET